tara:strand:+ start:4184 stop:4528 length:345 start_codon:yes stop_codon:yes gene_type:complete
MNNLLHPGKIAFLLGIVSLVPQVYKTFKTKDIDSYSLVFAILGLLSNACWILNGLFYTNDMPIVLSGLSWVLFYMYLVYLIVGQRLEVFVRGEARDIDHFIRKHHLKDIFSYFV